MTNRTRPYGKFSQTLKAHGIDCATLHGILHEAGHQVSGYRAYRITVGESRPSPDEIKIVARELRMPVEELLDDNPKERR